MLFEPKEPKRFTETPRKCHFDNLRVFHSSDLWSFLRTGSHVISHMYVGTNKQPNNGGQSTYKLVSFSAEITEFIAEEQNTDCQHSSVSLSSWLM